MRQSHEFLDDLERIRPHIEAGEDLVLLAIRRIPDPDDPPPAPCDDAELVIRLGLVEVWRLPVRAADVAIGASPALAALNDSSWVGVMLENDGEMHLYATATGADGRNHEDPSHQR